MNAALPPGFTLDAPSAAPQAATGAVLPAGFTLDQPQATSPMQATTQGLSGVDEGIANTLGFPVDMVNMGLGFGAAGLNKVAGTDLQPSQAPVGGSQFFKNLMAGWAIKPPTNNPVDRFVRRTGQDVGASIVPGMGAAAGAARPALTVAGSLASGALGGAGAATARQVAPGNAVAETAAELAGSLTPSGAEAMLSRAPRVPTTVQLIQAGRQGFKDVRNMGVDYNSAAVAKMAADTQSSLEGQGILRETAPQTYAILDRLQNPPANSVAPISGLMAARQTLASVAKDFRNTGPEQIAARTLRGDIENLIANPQAGSVVQGQAAGQQAANVYAQAVGNWGAGKRSARLAGIDEPGTLPGQGIEGAARLRAAAANSGLNLDNAIRSRVASLLQDPNKLAGYSPQEVAMLHSVAQGTAPRNVIRMVGNWLGGGGGLGSAGAALMGGVVAPMLGISPVEGGAYAVGSGIGLRMLGNKLTANALRNADQTVRMRSPLYQRVLASTPQQPAISPLNQAIVGRLLASTPQAVGR